MSNEQKNRWLHSFTGVLILVMVTYSTVKNYGRRVEDVAITIKEEDGNFFTDPSEVKDLITLKESDYVLGTELSDLNPKVLEARVEASPFISDAQVYRDLKGNVKVEVKQSKPIARIFNPNGKDKYIDMDGNILPVNAKHTARVPLMELETSFSWEGNLKETTYGKDVWKLLRFIEADAFWKAQIAHLMLKKNGDVELFPQVTKQVVMLGYPKELDKRFKKLKLFYKQILPAKGWNAYHSVSLKYGKPDCMPIAS